MMDHIAVMLRGHIRTFNYTHELLFNFFEKIAKNVDYYMATWRPSSTFLSPTSYLNNRNLVAYTNLHVTGDYYDAWKSPSFLSLSLLPFKKQREKTVTYDAVFDTRFDVAPFINQNTINGRKVDKSILKPRPNTVYTHRFELHKNNVTQQLDIAVADWFFMMDSPTYDRMIERITAHDHYGNQIGYFKFAQTNNINVNVCDFVYPIMVRPDMVHNDKRLPNLSVLLHQQIAHWDKRSYYDKLQILEENKICIFDYVTDAQTCSIFASTL